VLYTGLSKLADYFVMDAFGTAIIARTLGTAGVRAREAQRGGISHGKRVEILDWCRQA
jgi:3-phosphoglycerate kinase